VKVFWLACLALASGCQTFVEVTTPGSAPVFTWRSGAPVTGLLVTADPDCDAVHGKMRADSVWWQVTGPLTPPVTYGVVPRGATELAPPRPLADCGKYTVTVTDASLQGESTGFRP
jgi:hypothetical protein